MEMAATSTFLDKHTHVRTIAEIVYGSWTTAQQRGVVHACEHRTYAISAGITTFARQAIHVTVKKARIATVRTFKREGSKVKHVFTSCHLVMSIILYSMHPPAQLS